MWKASGGGAWYVKWTPFHTVQSSELSEGEQVQEVGNVDIGPVNYMMQAACATGSRRPFIPSEVLQPTEGILSSHSWPGFAYL